MKTTALLSGACLILAGQALAQAPSTSPSPSSTTGTAASGAPSTEDFVNKVAVSDMFEIQSSELALQKDPDRSNKPFARRMVTDHTATTGS